MHQSCVLNSQKSATLQRFYKHRIMRRFSTTSNTMDFAISGSVRRMSMVSRRGSVFSSDSGRMTTSHSVYSSQSVPMLSTSLDKVTSLSNGGSGKPSPPMKTTPALNGGIIKHSVHACNGQASGDGVNGHLLQRERHQSGLRVHYDDETIERETESKSGDGGGATTTTAAGKPHSNGKLHVHYDDEEIGDIKTHVTSSQRRSEYSGS